MNKKVLAAILFAFPTLHAGCCQPENRFSVYGDFLWWQPTVNHVELTTSIVNNSTPAVFLQDKNVNNLYGRWDPGFRIGLGYQLGNCDDVELLLTYTNFYGRSNHLSNVSSIGDGSDFRQGWSPYVGPNILSAEGHWSVNLNVVDLEIAKHYCIGRNFFLRPHAGVRAAWLDFNYNAQYEARWYTGFPTFFDEPSTFRGSSDFSSGGLKTGSEFQWNFCDGFGLFGDFAVSLLYGQFKVKEFVSGGRIVEPTIPPPTFDFITQDFLNKQWAIRFNASILLGLKWFMCLQNGSKISLFAGYELNNWFRVNELCKFVTTPNDPNFRSSTDTYVYLSDDIGFQGLTVRAAFDF